MCAGKMTKAGMPEARALPENTTRYRDNYPKSDLLNKAPVLSGDA